MSSVTSQQFPKVNRTYSLKYYMKGNNPSSWPADPASCVAYFKQHGEWPFLVPAWDTLTATYWAYTEHQKRRGVYGDQHFTPPAGAEQLADLVNDLAKPGALVLDACCGFGMLAGKVSEYGFPVLGFDRDYELVHVAHAILPEEKADGSGCAFFREAFEDFGTDQLNGTFDTVISNPPFSASNDMPRFFHELGGWLKDDGLAFIILPVGFVDKTRPAALAQALRVWDVVGRYPMKGDFETTNIRAEIVVMQKVAPGLKP